MAHKNLTEPFKELVCGILLLLFGCWFWHSLVKNPFNEIALIKRSQLAVGTLIETEESEQEDFRGHVYFSDIGTYVFRAPDGLEYKATTRAPSGQLRGQQPIEYLSNNPSLNRIKGDGCQSMFEWLWRKMALGGILLVIFLSPGVFLIKKAMGNMKTDRRSSPH